jgi:hypothetical protein
MFYKVFWVFFSRRRFLVSEQRFGTICLSHLQGLETLKMGQTNSPETLVSYQKTTPGGKKPKRRYTTKNEKM